MSYLKECTYHNEYQAGMSMRRVRAGIMIPKLKPDLEAFPRTRPTPEKLY